MNYALVENGVVTNLIWLHPGNAGDFPAAVALGDRPVAIGDAYSNGVFMRDGAPVRTPLEEAMITIEELDSALLDAAYNNIVGSIAMETATKAGGVTPADGSGTQA